MDLTNGFLVGPKFGGCTAKISPSCQRQLFGNFAVGATSVMATPRMVFSMASVPNLGATAGQMRPEKRASFKKN